MRSSLSGNSAPSLSCKISLRLKYSLLSIKYTCMRSFGIEATLIIKDKDGKTEITYKAGFYRGFMGNDPPEELNDENSKKKVKLFIESALKGLKSVSEK